MKLLVTGGKTNGNEEVMRTSLIVALRPFLDDESKVYKFGETEGTRFELLHGNARGTDRLAEKTLRELVPWIPEEYIHRMEADWEAHGKLAGFRNNKSLLEKGRPDYLNVYYSSVELFLAESKMSKELLGLCTERKIPSYIWTNEGRFRVGLRAKIGYNYSFFFDMEKY